MRVCHGTCDVIKKSHHVLPFTAEHHRLIRLCACSLHQSRVKVHPQPVSALKRLPLRHRSQSIPKTSRLRLHSMHSSCLSLRPLSPSSRRRASSQALTTPLAHQRLGQPPSQRPGRLGSPLPRAVPATPAPSLATGAEATAFPHALSPPGGINWILPFLPPVFRRRCRFCTGQQLAACCPSGQC